MTDRGWTHDHHAVIMREWRDFYYERVTLRTLECDTCGEELAAFSPTDD